MTSIQAETRKLCHMDITTMPSCSTLSDANKYRPEIIFESIYRDLYTLCHTCQWVSPSDIMFTSAATNDFFKLRSLLQIKDEIIAIRAHVAYVMIISINGSQVFKLGWLLGKKRNYISEWRKTNQKTLRRRKRNTFV